MLFLVRGVSSGGRALRCRQGRIYKIGSNCRIITKCAGAVYALTKLIPVSQLTNGKNNDKKIHDKNNIITIEPIRNITLVYIKRV